MGAPEVGYIPTTFNTEIGKFKNWIETRLSWLDSNMPGDANGPLGVPNGKNITLRLFPNPASELVYIESNQAISRIEILQISGARMLLIQDKNDFSTGINVSALPPGLYLLQLVLKSGERISRKLVLN